MDQNRDLQELIGLVYDGAVDPSRWPVFLDRLCDMAPGGKSVMMLHDAKTRSISQSTTARWEEDWMASYTSHYVKLNKWTEEFVHFDAGQASVVDEIVPRDVTLKSEFYQDWLRPQGLITGVTVSIFKEDLRYMNVSVLSRDTAEDIQKRNAALLKELTPHLRRATQIKRQVADLALASRAIEQAFDHLDRGVALLYPDARSLYLNKQAERYFESCDGLILHRDGRVGCQDHNIEKSLHHTIAAAAETARGSGRSAGTIMAVPRQLAPLPWSLMVAPMPASALGFGRSEGVVALFIVDPNQKPTISVANLRAILGLTAAEARIAIALAEGKSPEEIAKAQGTAILTVRTHLRNAMNKTGVSRIAEFVILILRCGSNTEI